MAGAEQTIIIEGGEEAYESFTLAWLTSPFDAETELADSVVIALATDARADDSDRLPGFDETDRRGWWGNLEAEELFRGWDIGCRLWLLSRERILPGEAEDGETIGRVEAYLAEGLDPFIVANIASAVEIDVRRVGLSRIDAVATIIRGPRRMVELRFQSLWEGVI